MRRILAALLLACFASGRAVVGVRAADPPAPAADRVVALPPFMVEEAGRGPPWRYVALPGFEILARCGDPATRTVVQAYHKLHHLLDVVLPANLRVNFSEPRRVILYSESLAPAASQDVIARLLRGDERHTPPPREEAPAFGGRGGLRGLPSAPRVSFMPNLRLSDADATYVFTIVREENLQVESLYLTPDYVSFLLRHRTPALPAWFMAAFLATYRDMTFRDGTITLKPLVWISEAHTDALKKDPKTAPAPGPLDEFFRGDRLRLQPGDAGARDAWTAQGALLMRWALDPAQPERREAF